MFFFFFSDVKYFREVRAEVERLVRRLIAIIQLRDGWWPGQAWWKWRW